MIAIRYAPKAAEPGLRKSQQALYAPENARITEMSPALGEANTRALQRGGLHPGAVVLIGGATLEHFRIRVAQSHLRTDLLPSQWSLAGIVAADRAGFWSVPLAQDDVSAVPSYGGLRYCPLRAYDDPEVYPNVAVVRFKEDMRPLLGVLDQFIEAKSMRTLVDVPDLIVKWLAFIWGVGQVGNPLLAGHGLPSAVFVQAVAAVVDLDVSPGLVSTSTCPESIAAASRFWESAYAGDWPRGFRCVRQPSATVSFEHTLTIGTGALKTPRVEKATAPPSGARSAKRSKPRRR